MAKRRSWASWPLFLHCLLFLVPALAFEADFSFYPANAQACLNSAAAASKCSGATATDLNNCLCGNGGNFILATAACVGKNDSADTQTVYNTMSGACAVSGTPMDVSQSQFYAAANGNDVSGATSSSVTSKAATTSTATPTLTTDGGGASVTVTPSSSTEPGDDQKNEGLSTGATVGIAIGASVAGVGLIGGLFWFVLRRGKRPGEESHPMLPQQYVQQDPAYSAPMTFPPAEPSPGLSPFGSEAKHHSWGPSPLQSPDPSYRGSGVAWDSTQGPYKGPYAPSQGVVELPPETASYVFEMDGSAAVQQQQRQQQHQQQQFLLPGNNNSVSY